MSSRHKRDNNFGCGRGFVLTSDGGRNLSMEYDDAEFTDKTCQLAEKDDYPSNTQGHQRGLPRFDLGEHIGVQLGFDSLEESVLLQDQSQRVEAWGSHFSREENGVLGLEAVSQNIEFSTTATETCTISRHVNVWSEATSSESVQMLLNSVGDDEGNLVEESDAQCERSIGIVQQGLKSSAMDARDDNQEVPTSSEPASYNGLEQNNSASRLEDEGCIPKKEDAAGQQSDITASSQQTHADFGQIEFQETSNPSLGECNTEKRGKHSIEVTQQDELMTDIQGATAIEQGDTRNDITEKDIMEANLQGGSGLVVDKPNENNTVRCPTQDLQESGVSSVSSEFQGTSGSLLEKPSLDKTTKDLADSFHADVTLADSLLHRKNGSGNYSNSKAANEQDVGEMQKILDPVEVESNQDNVEKHVIDASNKDVFLAHNDEKSNFDSNVSGSYSDSKTASQQDVGKIQEILDPIEVESNQDNMEKPVAGVSHEKVVLADVLLEKGDQHGRGKHVIEASNKDVLLACNEGNSKFDSENGIPSSDKQSLETSSLIQQKANNKSTVVEADTSVIMQVRPGPLQSGNRKPEEHADLKTSHEPDFQKMEDISDPVEVDSNCDQTEKHVLNVSNENYVLGEMQRNQDMLVQKDNDNCGGEHVTEASNKNVLLVFDDEKLKQCEQGMPGSDKRSLETSMLLEENAKEHKGNSLKTEEIVIMQDLEHNNNETRQIVKCVVANSVSSQGDQNKNVVSTSAEKLSNDGTGTAGDVAERCLLEGNSFSNHNKSGNQYYTPERCDISSSEVRRSSENESEKTSIESVLTARENETTDEAIDLPERKSIASVLHTDTEIDKHPQTVSAQEPTELTLRIEQAMDKCQEPLQTHDIDATAEADPIKQTDQMNPELEKVVKEVNMSHGFKAQDDQNMGIALEANCCSTQNEPANVQECNIFSLEDDQKQENEKKNTSMELVVTAREMETMEKFTHPPERKEMPVLSLTGAETGEHNPGAVLVQDTKEAGQGMTDTCLEPVQITDACATPEGIKEVHMPSISKVVDDADTLLSSDHQQCMPISGSGDSSQQTLLKVSPSDISEREDFEKAEKDEQPTYSPKNGLPSKETEESGKDKDTSEAMEVSLEVGISLEPDNDSPARDGDDNILQGKASAENIDLASSSKWSSDSKDGGNKVDGLVNASGELEGTPVSNKTDDTFKFDVGTNNSASGGDVVTSVDFMTSGQMDRDAGCCKPFQATQSHEVRKDNSSAVCQTGEVQAEACQENAKDHVSRNVEVSSRDSVVQEATIVLSEVKAKTVTSGEKVSPASSIRKLEKKSMSHHEKSVDDQVPSLAIANSTQPTSSGALQTSTLPDLNATVTPTSVLFQQPFTDSQQVQLRAQILVYGSLIQGSLPEEALMLTAFADIGGASQNDTSLSDGGRSLWENAWHAAADRIHRKTFSNTPEAPINASGSGTPATVSSKLIEGMKTPSPSIVNVTDSRNSPVQGLRAADLAASRNHPLQTRGMGTPNIGRSGSKNTPSTIMSPPRPVWGMSSPVNDGMQGSNISRSLHVDPHQMAAARHLYQTPQLGHYPTPANSNPWLTPLHFPGPWLTPPQGTLPESGLPFSSFLVPEVTQETLNNRRTSALSSAPHTAITHSITHFPSMVGASTGHVTNANTDASKGIMGVGKQLSTEQKSRKRKKKSVSGDIAPTDGLMSSGAKVKSVTSVSKRPSSSTPTSSQGPPMAVPTSSNALFAPGTSTPIMQPVSNYQIISRGETGQRVIFSEETASRIEQAKLSAEEAASFAASAVRHSQGIWSQLAAQKSSGIVSDCEAKLASAAVAAAAAASVAKAAAAAAKVASDAAVQAKLMATEALNSDGKPDTGNYTEIRLLEGNQGHSRSIIAAARETAKKRVEAASAATKRAENLDAVVRAAELAAQAVTQAGAVVAMGDPVPLTLNALLEAGPETYWKLVTEQAGTHKDDNVHSEKPPHEIVTSVEKNMKHSKSKNKRDALKNEIVRNLEGVKSSSTEMLKLVEKGCKLIPAVTSPDNVSTEKDSIAPKENQVMGTIQTSVLISDGEAISREGTADLEAQHVTETYKKAPSPKANEIKEGSFVEVVSDEEGLRGVWFAAKVLSLKDGKALVLYDELLSDEGPGQLQEWIPLEGENGKPPRIRMAHPMTVMKFEGTRKRRRAAMGSYVWSVGDRVDAWIRDGWWEGIITEKKDDDESKLTVHFPGEGDTSIIKVYNLRPSLIWKDGQWVEWTYLKAGKEGTHEDELPSEKRQKLDKHDTEGQTKGKEKLQKIPNLEEAKKMQELNALMASGKDKSLVVVKNSTFDGSSAGIRVKQSGLQKEGSKVVFGVPKPTKKRKFMDVSKHYVADKMIRNTPDVKYSGKFEKHKPPVSQGHFGLKATNKADDKKLKRPAMSKPKDFKFGRGHEGHNKTNSEKDKNSAVNPTVAKETLGQELGQSAIPSSGIDGIKGGKRAGLGGNVPSIKLGEASNTSVSKEAVINRPSPSSPSNGVKGPPTIESDQVSKGKQSSTSDNSTLNIEKGAFRQEITKDKASEKATTDAMEPRRSNRRIQPTSRLLEGLQTSPIILKSSYMSYSHEKGGKTQSKLSSSIPKGNINS